VLYAVGNCVILLYSQPRHCADDSGVVGEN
jgi:hypothetical protein